MKDFVAAQSFHLKHMVVSFVGAAEHEVDIISFSSHYVSLGMLRDEICSVLMPAVKHFITDKFRQACCS